MTNETSPILIYTFRQTDGVDVGQELQMAIMYGLAASICTSLTGKTSRAKILMQQANDAFFAARESAANMNDERLDSLPDWIAARGYTDASTQSRYFYPFGSLLTSASVSDIVKYAFIAGEISPTLLGRTDLTKYDLAVAEGLELFRGLSRRIKLTTRHSVYRHCSSWQSRDSNVHVRLCTECC
jgi:hypothetical protein